MANEIRWTLPGAGQPSPPAAEAMTALRPGSQISKYQVLSVLGQGGFGITYRARDTQLGRDVAIKEYLPTNFAARQSDSMVLPHSTQLAEDFRWGRERFLAEAKTLAHLEHAKGIVNVYDFLEANGTAYMVMALVPGETLEARLQRDGPLPQAAIERLLFPLLDGLDRVHRAGFLHRDIKPANILVDATGAPALIDFGASRMALQDRTRAMTAIFTPGYAAFEQMTSAPQGPWTDIYALAATLYHCVAGAPPPPAVERMTGDRLVPAARLGQGRYAPALLAAIDAGLVLRAEARPQSIAQWRSLLGVPPSTTGAMSQGAAGLREPAAAGGPKRRAWLWPAIAAAVVLCLAGGGIYVWLDGQARAQREQAEAQAKAKATARAQAEARAQEEAHNKAWAQAKAANTVAAYQDYLKQYPQGRHAAEARQAVAALEQQQKADEDAWARAKAVNTDASYRGYVGLYPNGRYAAEARREMERLEDAAWAKAKSGTGDAGYSAYLGLYPAGRYVTEARREVERSKQLRTREAFRDCELCPEMIMVPRGSFMMGAPPGEQEREGASKDQASNDEPRHQVTLPKDFAMSKHLVTFTEFIAFVQATGHEAGTACRYYDKRGKWEGDAGRNWRNPGFTQGIRSPVVCVSFEDARAYVAWLRKETGKAYRLPTEAEYEYVARAGTSTPRYWGAGRTAEACIYANVPDASLSRVYPTFKANELFPCNDQYATTSPVDAFPPNPWGFHDILGNARQWTSDCWHAQYHGAPADGRSWEEGGDCSLRVVRGMGWLGTAWATRAAFRHGGNIGHRSYVVGIRVVRDD